MRSAAATYDDDFDAPDVPAKRKTARKTAQKPAARPRAGAKKTGKPGRFGFDMTKVARIAAIAMSATIVGGIMVNALLMQKGRHPAPLFGSSIALGGAAHVAAARPAPAAVTPPPATQADAEPAPAPIAAAPRHAARDTSAEAGDDPIGHLLQTGIVPAAAKAGGVGTGKTVSGVQRALAKLGYDVKPNGAMGPATRKAIEAFEKDRHLPVNGEMSRRLVKVLVAESGVKID